MSIVSSSSTEISQPKRGLFITLEGIDGVGKTTQTKLLAEKLTNEGYLVSTTRFPNYDSDIGRVIKQYLINKTELSPAAQHLLFCANRAEFIDKIKKLVDQGFIVICDRYVHSGIAYSMAKGLDRDWCIEIERALPQPDLIAYFDMTVEEAIDRKKLVAGDRYDGDFDFLNKVYGSYRELFAYSHDNLQEMRYIRGTMIEKDVTQTLYNFVIDCWQLIDREKPLKTVFN